MVIGDRVKEAIGVTDRETPMIAAIRLAITTPTDGSVTLWGSPLTTPAAVGQANELDLPLGISVDISRAVRAADTTTWFSSVSFGPPIVAVWLPTITVDAPATAVIVNESIVPIMTGLVKAAVIVATFVEVFIALFVAVFAAVFVDLSLSSGISGMFGTTLISVVGVTFEVDFEVEVGVGFILDGDIDVDVEVEVELGVVVLGGSTMFGAGVAMGESVVGMNKSSAGGMAPGGSKTPISSLKRPQFFQYGLWRRMLAYLRYKIWGTHPPKARTAGGTMK